MATVTADSRATLRTSLGNLVLEFIPDKAPKTCENFVTLANKGFYDGRTFHRIVKDFMVQGGSPDGSNKGGPGYTIRPEFNDTPHVKGTVSMARGNDPHSAGSQFFICTADARYLDSRYTAFARVIEGDEVLDKLNSVPTDIEPKFKEKSVPRDPVYINGIDLEGVEFEQPAPAPTEEPAASQDQDDDEDGEGDGGGKRRRTRRGRRGGSTRKGGDEGGAERAEEQGGDERGGGRGGDETGELFADDGGPADDGARDGGDEAEPARKKATRKKATSKKVAARKSTSRKAAPKKAAAKKTTRKKASRKKADDAGE